jgi:rhamnogalacturonyl hydrolase YesR/beta-xylosidase/lysophospholipase L1-like esterase
MKVAGKRNWYDLMTKVRLAVLLVSTLLSTLLSASLALQVTASAFRNPVLFADYSDPDVVRSGDDYYLVASSFQMVPALPILHSRDLVSWTIVAHAADRLPADFDKPQHGNGMWAPSLRHHDGFFWIYVGDPDRGIFMTRARNPRGPWEPLTLIHAAKGWIDPCPFWEDDGSMVLVHAWAKSRAGFNGVLTLRRMSSDGRRVLDNEGAIVFDGRERHPTIEGPKLYKRNGWYYIFAPAGGVKRGWQTVLRSKNLFGPYEDKIVLEQGETTINGPHQGAWVEAADGTSWFLHFQDRGAYGRVVHLQPMTWVNDWPEIGNAGVPAGWIGGVSPPGAGTALSQPAGRRRSEWQWHGNPSPDWATWSGDSLRLSAVPSNANLWNATNLYLQKFSAPAFTATTLVDGSALRMGERAGLLIMGMDYSALTIARTEEGLLLRRIVARDADQGSAEVEMGAVPVRGAVHLRVTVAPEAVCRFSYSGDGRNYRPLGAAFVARPGRWIGAKVGVFASAPLHAKKRGHARFDDFRIEPMDVMESASLIVAQDGSGDFRTIQEALDAIPRDNDDNRTILVRNGVFREKVRIEKSYVTIAGEDRERTRIELAELRRNWRASHPDDWGAAVVNVGWGVTDTIIANLTVLNDYGRRNGGEDDHQFAIRALETSNRIAVLHANVIGDGGDTFSPWNAESGLSYATDSYFEGHVDFVCPRGWSYIANSRFFGHSKTAGIWHDGSRDEDQKFVVRRSQFDGVPDFVLGRHHRDAQFYLLDAQFSPHMADRAIYAAEAPDPRLWGERIFYANARRDNGDFAWHADNLHTADDSPRDEDINAEWTFNGQWNPATLPAVLPFAAIPRPEHGWKWADPSGVMLRWTPGRNALAHRVHFGAGDAPEFRVEQRMTKFETGPLQPGQKYTWRIDSVTPQGIVTGHAWSFRADPRNVRIALVGDSTVTEKSGWGRGFKASVADSAAVVNLARGGRSTKTYINEGHWQDALSRAPSHVLLQFGHNDVQGKGLDRETDLGTFRANLRRYVDDTRAIGAKPILVTSLVRRNFDGEGRIQSDLIERAEATREVAAERQVPLIDLHAKSLELSTVSMGPMKTDGTIDRTHLNAAGSTLFGAVVANELASVAPELAPHVRKKKVTPVEPAWSVRMADSEMKRTPDPMWLDATEAPRWEYTAGLVLKGIFEVGQRTGEERYWKYAKAYYDGFIGADGSIRAYRMDEYNIDRINPGKPLFLLYEKTGDAKYRKAIEILRQQMREHPRTSEGGFWHKKRYPSQMWLDGLYMGAPFLAQYAKVFKEPALFDDVIKQFVLMETHARDAKTGLLYHGWDESRAQKWADPKTGRSPAFWGRAMGWYAMGLVETLDFIPLDHPRRKELIGILQRLAEAVTRVQDKKTGLWWQVVDQPGREGNYLEASVTTMFSFALLKGSRLGYLDAKYGQAGRRAYEGVLKELIEVDKDGLVNIHRVCQVAGLGGDPEKGERYRDGTYQYYVTERIRSNDPKAVGPFIFASLEMERR